MSVYEAIKFVVCTKKSEFYKQNHLSTFQNWGFNLAFSVCFPQETLKAKWTIKLTFFWASPSQFSWTRKVRDKRLLVDKIDFFFDLHFLYIKIFNVPLLGITRLWQNRSSWEPQPRFSFKANSSILWNCYFMSTTHFLFTYSL